MVPFDSLETLEKIAGLLAEADFDRAGCRWDLGAAVFALEVTRPAAGSFKKGGLFRKPDSNGVRSRLVIRQVREVSIQEEYDSRALDEGLLDVERAGVDFRIRLRSAHGLRIDLSMDRLEGVLEDMG